MILRLMAGLFLVTLGPNIRNAVQLEEEFSEDLENMIQLIFLIV
jgi:hypothetical protein